MTARIRRTRATTAGRDQAGDPANAVTCDVPLAAIMVPQSWRDKPIRQAPDYPDPVALAAAGEQLRSLPPLIFAGRRARCGELARAAAGQALLLLGGDALKSFGEFHANAVHDTLKVLLQMAVVLSYAAGAPVVKVARMAGQFAKPRSSMTETSMRRRCRRFR